MKYRKLSYEMRTDAPGWPGSYSMEIEPYSLIDRGAVANQYQVKLLNHFGSHMDGPRHFNNRGPRLAEMPIETFIYERPLLLDIPLRAMEQVTVEHLLPFRHRIAAADLLMIRSGFAAERTRNPQQYANRGPSFRADCCRYMMDHFRNLKAVAMDWISLATPSLLEDGVLAHQYLLGVYHDHYICIMEDVNFDGIAAGELEKVWALPLFVEQIDSAPVTVVAGLRD
ncbi:MAG: cyclase family protein [Paenibacillaceae bacterium]|nr:cyclase family protein [Paenibacillaceae bacterium]